MNNSKMTYAMFIAMGSGMIGFFANQLTEVYGCVLFGIGVALLVYAMANLGKK